MKVTVVDYEIGNLLSVCRALETCGADVTIAQTPDQVKGADRLVVPGVGAFGDCVNALVERGFKDEVLAHAASGRPYLGICVGMQMLFDYSEEFGEHQGLGLIPGKVAEIPRDAEGGAIRKRPHIGWSPLVARRDWAGTILETTEPGTSFYFVHTFSGIPQNDGHRLADCDYMGYPISAAVHKDNVFGAQFHPEKSAEAGLKVVRAFLGL